MSTILTLIKKWGKGEGDGSQVKCLAFKLEDLSLFPKNQRASCDGVPWPWHARAGWHGDS